MEYTINGRKYYEFICEKCQCKFKRRKDEIQKMLKRNDNKVLCGNCMRASKYENLKTKRCSKCKKEKQITEFYKRNKNKKNYCSLCKECMNECNKKWVKENQEQNQITRKKYRENNKEKIKEIQFKWKKENKKKINEYKKQQYYKNKKDEKNKFIFQTRNLIYKAFKRKGYSKNDKTEKILGCDYKTFIKHLLKTFKNNYDYEYDGKEIVHIDHIIPLSIAQTEEEVIKLCYYTNLQLLKAKDNLHKSNKINWRLDNAK